MGQVVVVGLDIAKSVFQVHGVDRDGEVVVRRRLRRSRGLPFFARVEPCRIGIEACASGHYWARELRALGHDVRLMAPSYVKPYVKRQKNDAADAEAICWAGGAGDRGLGSGAGQDRSADQRVVRGARSAAGEGGWR
jgi:transposase